MPAKVKIKSELKIEQAQVFKVGGRAFKTEEAAEKYLKNAAYAKERKVVRDKVCKTLDIDTTCWSDYDYKESNMPLSVDELIKKLPELAQLYLETNL